VVTESRGGGGAIDLPILIILGAIALMQSPTGRRSRRPRLRGESKVETG
jgi:hypothetical protein